MLGAADARYVNYSEFQPRYYEADTSDDQGNPIKITVNEVTDLTTLFLQAASPVHQPPVCVLMVKNMWLEPEMKTERNMSKHRKAKLLCMAASGSCIVATADKSKARFLQVQFLLLLH